MRSQIAGKLLASLIFVFAPSKSPSFILAIKAGISISTGQPSLQCGTLQ